MLDILGCAGVSACRVLSVAVTLARFPSESRWEPSRGDCTYSVKVHGHGSQLLYSSPLLSSGAVICGSSANCHPYSSLLLSSGAVISSSSANRLPIQLASSLIRGRAVICGSSANCLPIQLASSLIRGRHLWLICKLSPVQFAHYYHQGPLPVAHLQAVTHTARLYSHQGPSCLAQ
ncbi:hypothetical protein J6590_044090 [Homalodisca vitripennis]|nr:hypothetical protein J6590_044090 [Homalodisca vitripennis]